MKKAKELTAVYAERTKRWSGDTPLTRRIKENAVKIAELTAQFEQSREELARCAAELERVKGDLARFKCAK